MFNKYSDFLNEKTIKSNPYAYTVTDKYKNSLDFEPTGEGAGSDEILTVTASPYNKTFLSKEEARKLAQWLYDYIKKL